MVFDDASGLQIDGLELPGSDLKKEVIFHNSPEIEIN